MTTTSARNWSKALSANKKANKAIVLPAGIRISITCLVEFGCRAGGTILPAANRLAVSTRTAKD